MGIFDDLIAEAEAGKAAPDKTSTGMFDDLIAEHSKKGPLEQALTPITELPSTYSKMVKAGLGRVSEGGGQISEAIAEPHGGAGALKFIKGVGNIGAGGLEYLSAPIIAPFEQFGQTVQNITGIPKEYTAFGAQLLMPGVGLTRLPRAPVRAPVPLPAANAGEAAADAAQRLGMTPLSRAITSESPTIQAAGGVVPNVPIVGTPLRRATERTIDELGQAAEDVAGAYGTGTGNRALAGAGAREGIEANLAPNVPPVPGVPVRGDSPISQRLTEAYDRVDGLVNPNVTGPMPNTRNIVGQIDARRVNAGLPDSGATQRLQEALSRPGMNYDGIKDLRSHFGEMLDNQTLIPQGMGIGEVRRIYGALSDDMRLIIARSGGTPALQAWTQANNTARRLTGVREDLQRILNVRNEEGIFAKIEAMAGSTARADISLMGRVRGAIGPEHWDEIASAVITRMGSVRGNPNFSPGQFVASYDKMSEEGRRLLFRSTGNAAHADAIDDIVTVARRMRDLNRFDNPSGTGRVVTGFEMAKGAIGGTAKGIAGKGWGDPLTIVATVVGGRGLANFLASPAPARAMANWAQGYAAMAANQTPANISRMEASAKIFAAAVGKDFNSDKAEDFLNKLKEAMTPQVGAGEVRPQSKSERDDLPPGTQYIAPDNSVRVR